MRWSPGRASRSAKVARRRGGGGGSGELGRDRVRRAPARGRRAGARRSRRRHRRPAGASGEPGVAAAGRRSATRHARRSLGRPRLGFGGGLRCVGGRPLGSQPPEEGRRPAVVDRARPRGRRPSARSGGPTGRDERRGRVEQDDVAARPAPRRRGPPRRARRSPRACPPARAAFGDPASPRAASSPASIVRRSIPPGVTSRTTPLPSSGSSSTPGRRGRRASARCPRRRATSASRGAAAASPTPRTWRVAPAGFVSGPSRLNDVRTPISRRVGPAWRIAGWKFGREQEREAVAPERLAGARRVVVDPDAERVEHVGRAGARGDRPVAVLGDRDTGRGHDERRRGRDVERAAPVAAGPDQVDRAGRRLDPDDPVAHRAGEPGQLVGRLAAHPERDEEGGQLGRGRLAVHHRAHRGARLVERQRPAVDDRGQRGPDDLAHRTPPRRAAAAGRPRSAGSASSAHARPVANEPATRRAGPPPPPRPGGGSSPGGAGPPGSAPTRGGTGRPRAGASRGGGP